MFNNVEINFAAFALSGILAFLLGLLWYHPKVLGGRWAEARNVNGTIRRDSPLPYIVSFFLWMMAACFYAFLAQFLEIDTAAGFFCLSCLLWVAFALPPTFMSAMHSGYPFEAMAIDASHQLGGYYIFAAVHIVFLEVGLLA
ncbi:MAG: DUF1761 domain-containing protein [Micavibrio sp.]